MSPNPYRWDHAPGQHRGDFHGLRHGPALQVPDILGIYVLEEPYQGLERARGGSLERKQPSQEAQPHRRRRVDALLHGRHEAFGGRLELDHAQQEQRRREVEAVGRFERHAGSGDELLE